MTDQIAHIESLVLALPLEGQRLLLQRLSKKVQNGSRLTEEAMDAMAADPDIQRELGQIEKEFSGTEWDGLEGS